MENNSETSSLSNVITTKADIESTMDSRKIDGTDEESALNEKSDTPHIAPHQRTTGEGLKRNMNAKDLQTSTSIESNTSAIQVCDMDQIIAALPSTSHKRAASPDGGSEDGDQTQSQSQHCQLLEQASMETGRSCWICFASDEENRLAAWVQPCKCRGSTKWVHQSCLYRWVDEKQKGNALRTVSCQQCQTEYIIVFPQMGKVANILEAFDNLIKRVSPFLAAGIFVGSLYWTAVTYGAITFLQVNEIIVYRISCIAIVL